MTFSTPRIKLLAFLFLIPLALYGWSAVQGFRVTNSLHHAQFMSQWLADEQSDPEHLRPIPTWLGGGSSLAVIHQKFHADIDSVERDHVWLSLRGLLAGLGKLCAFAAALVSVALLVKLRYDSTRAMASQTYMLEHLTPSWQRIAQLMVVNVWLILGCMATQLVYEVLWSFSNWHTSGFLSVLMSLPLVCIMVGGFMLLRRLRAANVLFGEEPPMELLGRSLDRATAPQLWQWVEAIAQKAKAPLPDNIVVGIDQSFFVTSTRIALRSFTAPLEGRTLYLPLTYASVMSQAETAAVIGHELGHFVNQDTEKGSKLSALYKRVQARIWASVNPAEGDDPGLLSKPGFWVAQHFLELFAKAQHHWSRQQELAADKVGARVSGERVFAVALLRVCALSELIDHTLASAHNQNIVQALTEQLRRQPLSLTEHTAEHAVAHPFDTHPPTYQRVTSLALTLDADMRRDATRTATDDDLQWFNQMLQARPHAA